MDPKKPKTRPEDLIVEKIKIYLKLRGWYVKKMHGNVYQSGVPDLYVAHRKYGARWIEVKTKSGKLEDSQIENFQLLAAVNVGVWILTDMTDDDYIRLTERPANWYSFLKGM